MPVALGQFNMRRVSPVSTATLKGATELGVPLTFPAALSEHSTGVGEMRLNGNSCKYVTPVKSFRDKATLGTFIQRTRSEPCYVTISTPATTAGAGMASVVSGDALRCGLSEPPGRYLLVQHPPHYQPRWRPWGPLIDENLLLRTVLKAYAKVNLSEVPGLTDAAESSEVAKMLRLKRAFKLLKSPLREASSLMQDLIKEARRYRNAPKRRKITTPIAALESTWLEARYGWRPLMGQIQTYRDMALVGFRDYVNGVHKATATQAFEWEVPPVKREYYLWQYVNPPKKNARVFVSYTERARGEDKYTTHVYYKRTHLPDAYKRLLQLGLTTDSLPLAFWEGVPCSFVVDWFWDVGLWLEAWQPKPGTQRLFAISSIKRTADFWPSWYSTRYSSISVSQPGSYHVETLERRLAPDLPLLPTVNPGLLDVCRKADLTALASQRVANLARSFLRKPQRHQVLIDGDKFYRLNA